MIRTLGVRAFAAAIVVGASCAIATPSSADSLAPPDKFLEPGQLCPEELLVLQGIKLILPPDASDKVPGPSAFPPFPQDWGPFSPFQFGDSICHFGGQAFGYQAASAPTIAGGAVHHLVNYGATTEPGEPLEGGKMKKTIWATITLPKASRVVIDTFESSFDTVLAVYTGNAVNHLTKVISNDDTTVPGFATQQSLVQFNAQPNTTYRIQIGSKTGAEGDVFTSVHVFPPAGGLATLLASISGTAWQSRDYSCGYNAGLLLPNCGDPKFVLYNSMNNAVSVTGTSSLGPGITAPASFNLPSRGFKTAEFKFTPAFDRTHVRTVAGFFKFVASAGGNVVGGASHRALVVVKGASKPNTLSAAVASEVHAGWEGQFLGFGVRLTNKGSQAATGCHFRSRFGSRLKTIWFRADPTTGKPIGRLDVPTTIAAHQTQLFFVFVASQQSEIADPTFADATEVEIDCASTAPAPINLQNSFDITSISTYLPASIGAKVLAPPTDTLLVPAGGTAIFSVSAVNRGAPARIVARPQYAYPFADAANKQFKVSVCRTSSSGACLAAADYSVQYDATTGSSATFKVFIKAPAVDPGFDPTKRRVFLIFSQVQPVGFTYSVPIVARSVAVRRH